jgi:glucosylceramidase
MEASERRALLEHIYGKDGLGLSVARLTIGSSDYSAELYSYDDVDGDEALEHFSVARDEEYVIPMIKEILEIPLNDHEQNLLELSAKKIKAVIHDINLTCFA